MRNLDVKIFDNEEGQLENVKPRIKTILGKMGYDADIDARVVELGENSERLIESRPDIIICDNHFGDEPGRRSLGFNFVSRFKPQYPDCIFVIMTQEQFTNNEFGKLYPHPDLVVSKSFLNSEDEGYEAFVVEELARLIKRAKINNIVMPKEMETAFQQLKSMGRKRRPINITEINSLIEQMCYMGRPGPENVIDSVELEKIDGGMSNSIVATVSLKGASHRFSVPGVAKFSTRRSAQREIENHSRYVKWTLPYTWRVDVIGTGLTGEFGVVCYSFAHGGSAKPVPLDVLIQGGAFKHVSSVIEAVFDPNKKTWYAEERRIQRDIGTYISKVRPYFIDTEDWDTKKETLLNIIRKIAGRHDVRLIDRRGVFIVRIGEFEIDFSNFINFYFAKNWNIPVVECICHGDMNAGNIMVKPGSADFAFIDFQHTGWHHRARDFCSLEGSIRTLFPRNEEMRNFRKYFDREMKWILEGQDEKWNGTTANSDRGISALVRNLFLRNFDGSEYIEYIIASVAHTLWLLSFKDAWSDSQEEILVAKILCEMIYLQNKQ